MPMCNVLFRIFTMTTQIIKKIKKVSILVIGLIGLVNFGFCDMYQAWNYYINGKGSRDFDKGDCIHLANYNCTQYLTITINGHNYDYKNNIYDDLFCFEDAGTITNSSNTSCLAYTYHLSNKYGTCPTCQEQYTSQECEQEYSLMPISSCNSEYCELNNMCGTGENFNRSPLYINEVLQEGAPIIKVTIPEEINYDSQVDTGEFNLDIIGYGYDQDKMQQMVNTQHYAPTSQDMSNLIAKIADFLPLLAVALLVIWIRWCIKKVFRRK